MGKLTLLLVLAAVVGAATLTLATRTTAGRAARGQSESQADLLARQIAETGQSLALTQMMDVDGFKDPGLATQAYDGGRFEVTYEPDPSGTRQTATVTVRGYYGGAVHTVRSAYEFDPMDYPGPIWLDVPYATSQVSGPPVVSGGPQNLAVEFDPRRHDDLGLQSALPLSGVVSDFRPDMTAAGSSFPDPNAGRMAGLLTDLNVNTAEDLYQVVIAAIGPGDRTFSGPRTVTTAFAAPGATTINRVTGTLTLGPGANVSGEGVLLIEGGLVVNAGARLAWNGIVLLRSTEESVPVHLNGNVSITGGLVVVQDAYPPGGHMDVTVLRDRSGLRTPPGDTNGPWAVPGEGPFPWYNHIHRWESTVPEGRSVVFARQGSDPHEAKLGFRDALASAGSDEVYLEFGNERSHGHGQYTLQANGLGSGAITGTVRNGFPDAVRQAGDAFRTQPFRANQLRDFRLDVRSLRALRQRFDGSGCQVWPFCIGQSWDRSQALTVRVVRASDNATLYEAALYWHMREDEEAAHQAAEQAWRDQVASGTGFGTHLQMGSRATVAFALAPIVRLADRLGFDGNNVTVLDVASEHATTSERRANGTAPPPVLQHSEGTAQGGSPPRTTPAPTPAPSSYPFQMCHLQDGITLTIRNVTQFASHAGHGDPRGACSAPSPSTSPPSPATSPPSPASTPPAQVAPPCPTNSQVAICNKPGADGLWRDRSVSCSTVAGHLAHGCLVGTCAANGQPTTATATSGSSSSGSSTANPYCSVPTAEVKVCRPPSGGDSSWNEQEMRCSAVPTFMLSNPGALFGTCSSHGR